MTVFPALEPDEISYDLGRANISEEQTLSAGPVRFRHSARINGYMFKAVYKFLSQTQAIQIRTHYIQNQGMHSYFTVPSTIWGSAAIVASDALYRYAAPPEEIHNGKLFDITVELRVLAGNFVSYVLNGDGAAQPAVAPLQSFVFNGNAPFILNAGGVDPTLLLQGRGASQ